jgi:transposase
MADDSLVRECPFASMAPSFEDPELVKLSATELSRLADSVGPFPLGQRSLPFQSKQGAPMNFRQRTTKRSMKVGVNESLPVLRPNAAAIDIGAEKHFVSVPPDRAPEAVRHFGCFTTDLHRMAEWLKACGIETVAMEATGVYWVPVYEVLEGYGFELFLVDGRQTKNVSGRKSDVLDCQWTRTLHSYGLLTAAFVPAQEIAAVRAYWRQRESIVSSCARQIHLMQKALEQMNVQLHKVVTDITGVTGMAIMRAIVAGERDAEALASRRRPGVKRSQADIAAALTGNYRPEHVFALQQALESYDFLHRQLESCDHEIQRCMAEVSTKATQSLPKRPAYRRKNQPHFDLRSELHRITGIDLTRIEGIDALTAQTVVTEIGLDMSRFRTEKHLASWLGLAPNNRQSGKRVHSRRPRRGNQRAALALRRAAQSLAKSKSALGAEYRRKRAYLGKPKANVAMAHKLARLVYRLLKYGEDYVAEGMEQYDKRQKELVLRGLQRRARMHGFELVSTITGETVS